MEPWPRPTVSWKRFAANPTTTCTDASAEGIAFCPRLARLRTLELGWNHLTDRGAELLAASPNLPADLRLSVDSNRMSARGAEVLRGRFGAGLSFGKQHGERN